MRLATPGLLLLAAPLAAPRPVPALIAEFDRLGARPLWPGFTPGTIPLAICTDFSPSERDSVAALARRETAAVLSTRADLRSEFLARPGWQLAIEFPAVSPPWPEQFDPWNLTPLADGEVLHQRHLRLGGERGRLEVLNQWALTTPAGAHPLFNGIRRVLLSGLAERPTVTVRGDSTLVQGAGIEGRFTGMELVEEGQRIILRSH